MKKTLYKMRLKSTMGVVTIWSCWDRETLKVLRDNHLSRGFILWKDIEEYKVDVRKEQLQYLDPYPYCKVCQ